VICVLTSCDSYEGERTQCRDNRLLGEFELTGIPPMPRGQAELVTTFEVDANGLLKVSAQDRASGRKASISMSITCHAHLSTDRLQVSLIPLVASHLRKLIK
jgi:heat shock 70kDa protein 1/2/6/8